jgi:tetrahydromethanopterin S-methyltransferase subunit F
MRYSDADVDRIADAVSQRLQGRPNARRAAWFAIGFLACLVLFVLVSHL